MRMFLLVLGLALSLASVAGAQSALPTPTGAASSLTMACPSPATGSEDLALHRHLVWRALRPRRIGSRLATITGVHQGSCADSTGVVGTAYTYAGVCTDGAITAPASNFYTGTPSSPLAAGALTGSTS